MPTLRSSYFHSVLLSPLFFLSGSILVAGEPPAIDRLFPPGGQRGTSFEVKLTGKAGDGEVKLNSEADTITWALGEKRDTATVTIAPTARAGVHWLRYSNASGATELKPFVVGLIPEVTETEPNNKIAEAQQAALPAVTINAAFEKARDVDSFAVQLTKGQTLVAAFLGNDILNSPMDAVLQVSNARGTVLAQNNDDTSLDPRLKFTAPSDGTWYVRAFAFPSAPNSTIAFAGGADYVYRLTLTTQPVVEHTSPVVKPPGDGETALTLHGWNLASPTASLPAGSTTLESGLSLPFVVSASDIPVVMESQLPPERTLNLPVAVSGVIAPEGTDTYLINATKSQQLSFSVQARRYGSQLDPVLSIQDKDGKTLKEADDINGENPDAELSFTIPADGQYRIVVSDRYQHVSERYFYVLRCEETKPSFDVEVKATAFTVPTDKPLEIPLTIARRNGFAEAIDFRIEGLPEGLTAECPQSAKDGDSSKAVTIKVSGTARASFSGVIKIIAESADTKVRQPASLSLADRTVVSQLWLTAVAPEAPAEPAAAAEPATPAVQ
ncbi:MAG: PPC domain-containing protein [Planctomycetaceae bacterium]